MTSPGLWPRSAARATGSHAEQRVFEALARQLPRGWYAWHSLRIRPGAGQETECDFLLADPARGLLVLEVKGGRIEERDGRWFSNGRPLDEAPLAQAHRFASALRRRLEQLPHAGATPSMGVAVCFPDTPFDNQPANDDLAGRVMGADDLTFLDQALPDLMRREVNCPAPVAPQCVEALHQLWGADWTPRLRLGRQAHLDEADRLKLDLQQTVALDGLAANRTVLVEGGAGTGKTLLARHAALRMAQEGRRTLLLCYTEPLARWLAEGARHPALTVMPVKRFAVQLVREAGLAPGDESAPGFWREVAERAAIEAAPACAGRWDAVVVDEGQDFAAEDWLLVEELSKGRVLWAFWDPLQAFWSDRPMPGNLFGTRFSLGESYRCPAGVLALAHACAAGSGAERPMGEAGADGPGAGDAAIRKALAEGVLGLRPCPSATSVPDKLALELDKLRGDGFAPHDIAVISLRGVQPADSIVRRTELGSHLLARADDPAMESRVVVETFLRFKGLERPAIVITDLRLARGRSDLGRRLYIALTRALTCARVVDAGYALRADPVLGRWCQRPGA
jgi:hypothetical protein